MHRWTKQKPIDFLKKRIISPELAEQSFLKIKIALLVQGNRILYTDN